MTRSFSTHKRAKRRRRVLLLLLLAALGFYSLALSQGWLDRTAPELRVQVPGRVPVGRTLEVAVEASESVRYTYRYAGRTSAPAQASSFTLSAVRGDRVLELTATDEAGNETTVRLPVRGVPAARVTVRATETAVAGDPVGIALEFEADPQVTAVTVTLAGQPLRVFRSGLRATAFGGVPLGSETSTLPLVVRVTDEFGRVTALARTLAVTADPRPVEVLDLSPELLSSSTPENVALEERTLDAAYAKGLPTLQWRKPFLLPVEGESTSSYGDPRQYGVGGNVSYHRGADLAAPEGTRVRATNAGVVRVAGFYPIKGGLVVLDHGGGVFSLYFHQSKILVKAGQRVRRGEVVGEVGTTGLSTGPHLHWEMRVAEEPTNPLEWVGKVVP